MDVHVGFKTLKRKRETEKKEHKIYIHVHAYYMYMYNQQIENLTVCNQIKQALKTLE